MSSLIPPPNGMLRASPVEVTEEIRQRLETLRANQPQEDQQQAAAREKAILDHAAQLQQAAMRERTEQQRAQQQPAQRQEAQQRAQQQDRPAASPRTAEKPRRTDKPVSRVSYVIGSAKQAAATGVDNILFHTLMARKRVLIIPLVLLALIAVGYFTVSWVAPNLMIVAFVWFVATLTIVLQPWNKAWGETKKWKWIRRLHSPFSRIIVALLISCVVGVLVFAPGYAASLMKGQLSSIPLVGSLLGSSGAPVVLQPERGMVTDESFGLTEDGKYTCSSAGQTIVEANVAGRFNGVPFTVVTNDQGMTIKFADKPVGLGGFTANDLPVPLDGVNADNGSHSFILTEGPFGGVPETAAMCWVQ